MLREVISGDSGTGLCAHTRTLITIAQTYLIDCSNIILNAPFEDIGMVLIGRQRSRYKVLGAYAASKSKKGLA